MATKKINKGFINKDHEYVKYVDFNKAVLWRDRSLSLRPTIIRQLKAFGIKTLNFIDTKRNMIWKFKLTGIINSMILKKVGQEEQYYFSINLRREFPYENKN